MHFKSIRVIEGPNTLTYSRVITVNDGVHHSFAQRLDGIFKEVNAFPPLDLCANSNMLLEKYLRLVDEFLERTCKYLAIDIPAHAELIAVQHTNDFTLRDMLLWVIPEEEYSGIGRNHFTLTGDYRAIPSYQYIFWRIKSATLLASARTMAQVISHLFQVRSEERRVGKECRSR